MDSKIIHRIDLFNILLECWPGISPHSVHLADKTYIMPSRNEIELLLKRSNIGSYFYISDFFDCDKFSLLLHAYVVNQRYKASQKGAIPKDSLYPVAFGEIWYEGFSWFHMRGKSHAINLCITHDEGVLFVLPQKGKVQKVEKEDIRIDFIRI